MVIMVINILKLLIMCWVFGLKKWLWCNFFKEWVIKNVLIIKIVERRVVLVVDWVLVLFIFLLLVKFWGINVFFVVVVFKGYNLKICFM